jgi:hypothetical protein
MTFLNFKESMMFSSLMTGIGFGFGFWMISIPSILLLRMPTKEGEKVKDMGERTLEALLLRNTIGVREALALEHVAWVMDEILAVQKPE